MFGRDRASQTEIYQKNPLFLFLFQNRCLTTLTKKHKTYFFTLATVTFTADSSQENGWLFYTCFNATKNARAHQEEHTDESLTLLRRQGNSNMCFSVLICTNHNGEPGRNKQDRVKHKQTKKHHVSSTHRTAKRS